MMTKRTRWLALRPACVSICGTSRASASRALVGRDVFCGSIQPP